MNELDLKSDSYLTMLLDMEHTWQDAVVQALSVRDDFRSVSHRIISGLLQQVKEKEAVENQKEEELLNLRSIVSDLNVKLEMAKSETTRLFETHQRMLEEKALEHLQVMEVKDKELERLRSLHTESIHELTAGAKETLGELEVQLEEVLKKEEEYKSKISELEETIIIYEKKLTDWNRVSTEMCAELSDTKNKLQSCRFANKKIREEMVLWKNYCEKTEEEKKAVKKEAEFENKVLRKFNQIETFIKSEKENRDSIADIVNHFGVNLSKDIKKLLDIKTKSPTTTSCQTDVSNNGNESDIRKNTEKIILLEEKNMQLEEELNRCLTDLENLTQQNTTLRDVIRAMKMERENWHKEKEQIEEEIRVSKLEESVRLLKNNMMNEEKDISVWNALQEVKKEVSNLKNKNLHKATKNAEVNKFEISGQKVPLLKGFRK